LELEQPKTFDIYYFVEKNSKNAFELRKTIDENFPSKKAISHVVNEDCNIKIKSLAEFLRINYQYRALMFIDPYGMSVDWSSIEALNKLGIDLWILVPTGIGVSRLLKNDGNIDERWIVKLEKFLGISQKEIIDTFYKKHIQPHLFDSGVTLFKEQDAVARIHCLYSQKLRTVFKKVSDAFVLKNSNNSIMYHFMMATNNDAAFKIANDVVKKYKL
jgi:three-Cys-motif partner protein